MAKKSLLQTIKDLFKGGGSSSSSNTKKASKVSNYGGGTSTSYKSYSQQYRDKKDEEEERRKELKAKMNATTDALASIGKKPTPALESNGKERIVAKIGEKANKPTPPDPKDEMREASRERLNNKIEQYKAERKEFNKATNDRYNVRGAKNNEEKLERRQAQKSQEFDPDAAIFSIDKHPVANSFVRGAASGATFGATDLISAKGLSGRAKEVEDYYQAHKNQTAETVGEIAGSLASFGLTAGATEKLGAKAVSKVAPNAAERLAEKGIIQNAAKRSVNRAVKKGLIGEASEELIKQVGRDKAKKIVAALGTDVIQNLTTGAMYDINRASTEYEVGSPDWWKELGKSAALNFGITGGIAGASALSGGKKLAIEAADTLASKSALRSGLENAERVGAREADDVVEQSAKATNNEQMSIDDLLNQKEVKETAENAKATPPNAKEAEQTARAQAEQTAQTEAEQTAKSKVEQTAKEEAEQATKDDFTQPQMRGRYEHLNEGLKKATDEKVGVRKGTILAEERASAEERKRIIKESGAEIQQAIKDAIDNAVHGGDFTYKVFTQGQRDDLFFDSYNAIRNSNSVSQVVEEIEEKLFKVLRESETNPWAATEQITLKDLTDMLAVEQLYKDNGLKLPPEYEEIMTRLINLQGTQYGQGQRGRYMLLREHSPRFRETMIKKDVAKYIDNVFGSDRLESISRSLDANHGEKGWLEKEINRIADYNETFKDLPLEERIKAANEAYKQLEKEILLNTKMSIWDVINLYRHTGMLSAIATGGRNILGNASQFIMRELSDKMLYLEEQAIKNGKHGADFTPTTVLRYKGKDSAKLANHFTNGAVGKLTKLDDKYFNQFADPEYAKKMTDVINEAVGDMMNIEKYETNAQKGAKYVAQTAGEKAIKGLAWLPRKATKAVNFMLNEPDSWAVEARFRKGLMRYLEANGITDTATLEGKDKILKQAIEHAKEQALEDTYKKANRVTTVLENVRRAGLKHDDNVWKNLAKKGAMISLDAELPYLKVPINVGINTVKYSPINIVKSLVDINTAARRGDVKALSKGAEELAKGFTGTALATLGFLLNCDEQESEDSSGFIAKAKDELKEYGIKDYSLKLGDNVYDISNIGQGATQFLMGARAAEIVNENGGAPKGFLDNVDLVRECFGASIDSISEMGILDNALGVIDAFGNDGDYEKGLSERVGDAATNIGWDYAGQFIPQPLRGVARGTTSADLDTGVRKSDTTPTKKRIEYNKNKLVSAIPYVNEHGIKAIGYEGLPHKVDTHGNLVNERKTNKEKLNAVINNTMNPVRKTKVHIPEADKIEMSVTDEDGNPYKTKGFDPKREYKAKIGTGDNREVIELTGKEREQVARAAKHSGKDGAASLIKKGMFGDRLGDRAQEVLKNIPEDEEKAREYIFSTPEWKNASNEQRKKWLDAWYGEGTSGKGVKRTTNAEAYINVAGNSEGDFRFQNDLTSSYQDKYEDTGLSQYGIDKGTWADIVQSCQDSNHKWNEESQKNQDTINSAKKTKAGLLAVEGLTTEQRIAAYQVIRGKRNGFGWNDWDGVSGGGSGYYRRGYYHYGHGGKGKKAKVPTPKKVSASSLKKGEALVSKSGRSSSKATVPTLARVEAKIDLPTKKR